MNLEKAIEIAKIAHEGQVDKLGECYIKHCIRVMDAGTNDNEKIVGILHDVVEDTNITLEDLKNAGFDEAVIEAIDAITRRENETYSSYIDRVSTNQIATVVKLNDLKDNLNLLRFIEVKSEHLSLLNRYIIAYKELFIRSKL